MGEMHYARAELVLAADDGLPLNLLNVREYDPLEGFARAFSDIREDLGEDLAVVVDLRPLTNAQARRRQRKALLALEAEHAQAPERHGLRTVLFGTDRSRATRPTPRPRRRRQPRAVEKAREWKLDTDHPQFEVQILLRAQSEIAGRAQAHLKALLAAFAQFDGVNWLKVDEVRVGPWSLGADAPWRRKQFDLRFERGLFRPAKHQVVAAGEIIGLLKPPTVLCAARNVQRSGGLIPPAPRELPTYRRQPGVLPLGFVRTPNGERSVGVRLEDTLFSLMCGRAGSGKTEAAINRFVALARAGIGCLYFDPHGDALTRMKPYLVDHAARVVELDLAARERQASWNPLSMEGLGREHLDGRVSAVVDSIASTLKWGEVNGRALNLTTASAKSLCEIALRLPTELNPTIFQMTTILSDEDWRAMVIPHLSPSLQQFWTTRFPKLASEAITPVTNLLDRMRNNGRIASLFGSPRSTFNARAAMDQGLIVLASSAGSGPEGRLMANFVVYDVLQAGLSREDMAPEARRPFHLMVDEMAQVDGAASGNIARLVEECRKFKVFMHGMVQSPTRLSPVTREALFNNRSHLFSGTVSDDSAVLLSKQFGRSIEPTVLSQMPKYSYLAQVTHEGNITTPFLVRGHNSEELWGDVADPAGVPELDATIDHTMRRQPILSTLKAMEALDEQIYDALEQLNPDHDPVDATRPVASRRATGEGLVG